MLINDDRTTEQRSTHVWLVVGTDKFLSGWGEARGGVSYAAWACKCWEDLKECEPWVESRGDMSRVRVVSEVGSKYRPRGAGHLHIYVWKG